MTLFEKLLSEEPMLDDPRGERINLKRARATKYSQSGKHVPLPDVMADPTEYLQAQKSKVTAVKYHYTNVFVYDHNAHEVTLDTGGWHTKTTKERMHMMAHKFNLNYSISQRAYQWYIRMPNGETKFFGAHPDGSTRDWMTFNTDTGELKDYKILPDGEHAHSY